MTNWKNLKHAHGPATRVPEQIAQLYSAASPLERDNAYWALWDTLVKKGEWFDASAPAVALLLDSVAKAPDPKPLIALAADIVGGDQLRGWLAPPGAPLAELEKAAHAAVIERKAILRGALGDKAGGARGAAAMLLAMVPELRGEMLPVLLPMASEDPDLVARTGALLALGRLASGDEKAEGVLKSARAASEPAAVRGAAGVAWLRFDDKRSFRDARSEIADFLASSPDVGSPPWFRAPMWYRTLPLPDAPGRALVALGRHRGERGVDDLVETALALGKESGNGAVETQAAKVLLDIGGFPGEIVQKVPLPEELGPEQTEMAKKLAATHLVPAGGHRLTASGAVRRRWIGVDPPGPLDRRVKSASGASVPVWRVWQERYPVPDDVPDALDRWQSLIEYAARSYPPHVRHMQPADLEKELAAVPVNDDLFARAARIATDLGERFAAADRGQTPILASFVASSLLFLPLVRNRKPIDPAWDRLMYVGKEPQAREVLASLPEDRREEVLYRYVRSGSGLGFVEGAMEMIDLAPTPRVLGAIEEQLDALAGNKMLAPNLKKLRARLPATGAKPASKAKDAAEPKAAAKAKPTEKAKPAGKAKPAAKRG